MKEDILQCDSAELSLALSCFIKEVRRPNGEPYSPDSIFYLCLAIQQVHTSTNVVAFLLSLCLSRWLVLFPCARLFGQFLFTKGRIENIFTDKLYSQFASEISGMLQPWKPKLLPSGMISDHWLHHEEEVVIVTSSLSIEISIVVCCFRFFSPLTRWYF